MIQKVWRHRHQRLLDAPPGCTMWLSWLPGEKRSWYRVVAPGGVLVTAGRHRRGGAGDEVVASLQPGEMVAVIRRDSATKVRAYKIVGKYQSCVVSKLRFCHAARAQRRRVVASV